MAMLPELGETYGLTAIFRAYPQGTDELLALNQAVMRGESPLSAADREAIATYVSGLNGCAFCYASHKAIADRLGFPAELCDRLQQDGPEAEGLAPSLRPIVRYAQRLTAAPQDVDEADVGPIYEAGWDERAVHDAARVVALFNYMNRFVEGLGASLDAEAIEPMADHLAEHGYRLPDAASAAPETS